MKLNLYLAIIFLIKLNSVSSQNLNLFVDTSNVWYEYGGSVDPILGTVNYQHLTYYYSNDTVINSTLYKKLLRKHQDTTYQGSSIVSIQSNIVLASMFRQDSLKIYFVIPGQTSENIYCNFDVTVGDTINYPFAIKKPVTAIDSIPFGASYRKRFHVNGLGVFYEGIGCQMGLFHGFGILIEGGEYLVCFKQHGITQYVYYFQSNQPPCPSSSVLTGVVNVAKENGFDIYPNPTGSILNIRDTQNQFKNSIIEIKNYFGQSVYVSPMTSRIDLSGLSAGMYFLTIQDSINKKTIKIIKE